MNREIEKVRSYIFIYGMNIYILNIFMYMYIVVMIILGINKIVENN